MSAWLTVVPPLLLAVAVIVVPGWLLAFSFRFRVWDAFALGPPLGLGVLTVADLGATHTHHEWGLPLVAAATGTLCLTALILQGIFGLGRRRRDSEPARAVDPSVVDGVEWNRRASIIAAVVTLGAAILGCIAVAKGMHTPSTINQNFDAAFHMNSIDTVARHHNASPLTLVQLNNADATSGFYPPLFAAIGGLVVLYGGVSSVVAANVAALAIVVLWPLSVSIMVRRIARPTCFGYGVAMVGSVTVVLFPALLLNYGTLWPNALSYLALAPMLVLVFRVLCLDESRRGSDPHGRLPWFASVAALVVMVLGAWCAHPGVILMVINFGFPLVMWWCWRRASHHAGPGKHLWKYQTLAMVGSGGVLIAFNALIQLYPPIKATFRFSKPVLQAPAQALGQALFLSPTLSSSLADALWATNYAFGLLAILGMVYAVRHRMRRLQFLIAGWAMAVVLVVMAASYQSSFTNFFTGFWYNDSKRIIAALPVFVLPLAAVGADGVREALRGRIAHLSRKAGRRWLSHQAPVGAIAAALVIVGTFVLQGGTGLSEVSRTVAVAYRSNASLLVNSEQAALFRRLPQYLPAGETIAGSPYTGAILAGVLSGRSNVYSSFQALDPLRKFVALNFNAYQDDPAVCTAVQRLGIGIVLSGENDYWPLKWQQDFTGFDGLRRIAGLTPIDGGGSSFAYRVGPCRPGPLDLTTAMPTEGSPPPNLSTLFGLLGSLVSDRQAIAGSPYRGEVLASVISGRAAAFPSTNGTISGSDRRLLAAHFNEYLTRPDVCAAVKRLKITAVVSGPLHFGVTDAEESKFAGFAHPERIPGLAEVGRVGETAIYLVSSCSTVPTVGRPGS